MFTMVLEDVVWIAGTIIGIKYIQTVICIK